MDVETSSAEFKDREINAHRGYGSPEIHSKLANCQLPSVRKPANSLVLPEVQVGAIRISATGWEGWIIEGLKVSFGKVKKLLASRLWLKTEDACRRSSKFRAL